jgi:hypothetical protein
MINVSAHMLAASVRVCSVFGVNLAAGFSSLWLDNLEFRESLLESRDHTRAGNDFHFD